MDLISKKELLSLTGISYGQLYRWKRANLIPEEWFIKTASHTGQETFLPKAKIIPRIQAIINTKNKYSLDELSKIFCENENCVKLNFKDLNKINEINNNILARVITDFKKETYNLYEIALFVAISKTSQANNLTDKESIRIFDKAINLSSKFNSTNTIYIVFKVDDKLYIAFSKENSSLEFDDEIETIETCNICEIANELKAKLYKNKT